MNEDVGRLQVPMADIGQLHIVESLEELEAKYFSHYWWERSFLFALFFDHQVETAGNEIHNDG